MKTYLVGGAVRDQLLGLPVKEKDWVVVGATVQDMLQAGFRPVGKDFPVFLHPVTKEEYALARTERKIGRGYKGFTFNTSPDVTLEEDLKRRDLTINAMAETPTGEIIDPFHGRDDLTNKTLRHVSPAFTEDPVRILRVARFAARFGFNIAPKTLELMRQMVINGEVNALQPDRVFKELDRALSEPNPEKFFEVLDTIYANKILFPKPIDPVALKHAVQLSSKVSIRFAAAFHTLGENEPQTLCKRYPIPTEYRDLMMMAIKYFPHVKKIHALKPNEILLLLINLDAFRRESRFQDFLTLCEAINRVNVILLDKYYQAVKNIDIQSIMENKKIRGKEIANKINEKRLDIIQNLFQSGERGNSS